MFVLTYASHAGVRKTVRLHHVFSHEKGAEPCSPAPPFTWSDASVAAVHGLGTAGRDGVAAGCGGLGDGPGLCCISSRAGGQENRDGQNELLHNRLR